MPPRWPASVDCTGVVWARRAITAKAMQWYRKGAAAGSGSAMYDIGALYRYGLGVPQDYAKAIKWLKRAEASGSPSTAAMARKTIVKIRSAEAAAGGQ